MCLLAALLLLGPGDPPGAPDFGDEAGFLRMRGGAWVSRGFKFEAVRTDSIRVESKDETLPSAGLDLGIRLPAGLFALATAELSLTSNTRAELVGLGLGFRERRRPEASTALPDEASVYAGAFYGRFEVDAPGFGDFDDAIGFRGGLAATWRPSPGLAGSLIAEYRFAEFDYKEDVYSGDTSAGGSGVWLGLALDLRF